MWSRQGSRAAYADCTTTFNNAHGTVFRELVYRWHPWFGMRVAIHEAGRKGGVKLAFGAGVHDVSFEAKLTSG